MQAANTRPWERDYTIRQTRVLAETQQLRQGPGKYDFVRLSKLDGR